MQTILTAHINGDTLTIRADFAQASSPIMMLDGQGRWTSTPFQVADFRHSQTEALKGVNRWCENQGGGLWTPGRTRGIKISRKRA